MNGWRKNNNLKYEIKQEIIANKIMNEIML